MSTEENATAQAAAEKVNLSVRLNVLEQRYVDLQKDRQELSNQQKVANERIASLEDEKEAFQATILKLKDELSTATTKLQMERGAKEEATALVTVTQERACRLEAETDNLREEVSRLTEANKSLQSEQSSLEMQHKLMNSAAVPMQYEVERLKKEVDVIAAHSKWLEAENSRASQELVKAKTQHSQLVITVQEQLDHAVLERDEHESKSRRLAMQKQELEVKIERLSQDFNESRQEGIAASEAAEKELLAERKLADLHKGQLERVVKRNERLEKELQVLREVATKLSADTDKELDTMREQTQKEANTILQEQQAVFAKEIEVLKNELSSREAAPSMRSPLMARRLIMMNDREEPMGLTELYSRLNETEDELQKARAECEKLQSYVHRVEAEVAAKTPQMLRQRKEYEIAVDRLEEMQVRLRDSIQESKLHREEATELREELSRMHRRNDELQGESKDLAKHIQALLSEKAGAEVLEGMPTSVEGVQQQNQQLLVEQRRLTTQIEELQQRFSNDRTVARLQQAEEELETLQEERRRQEKLVASIVQQRDLYRALLSSQDGAPVDSGNAELIIAQHEQQMQAAVERCKALEQDLATTRAEMAVLKGDKDSMLERIERYTVHTKELTLSIDKLQYELSTANANAARDRADSSYHRDKCARSEQNMEALREEINHFSQLRKDTNTLNSQLQQQLSQARADVGKLENDLRQTEMKLRLAKTQEDTAKSAEARLVSEVAQLRSEVARQGSLSETIQRIEASLAAKSEQANEKLKEEAERLKQLLEHERSKFRIELENIQGRARELELAIAQSETKKDDAMKESIASKGEALTATAERQSLVAKIASLESELSMAMKKVGSAANDPAEVLLQNTVEGLAQQLETAKNEISTLKERAGNFEKMAKESEHELTLLTTASDDFRKGKEVKIMDLQFTISKIKEEGKKKDEVISELTTDLSSLRGEQEAAEAILKERIVGLESQVVTAKKDAESATARTEELIVEVQKYRDDARKAQDNYERELELHAEASKDLRAAREESASEQSLRRAAVMRFENAQLEMAEKDLQLELQQEKMADRMKEMEDSLKKTREQNDLLLSQFTTLGDQVEKTQSDRIEASSGEAVSSDEVETLRKDVSDLREVVKFLRSEREMNDAKIDTARRTAEREKAVSAVTARSLDEARAELKVLQDQVLTASTPVADLEEKLRKGEEQLTLLQESNKLLREERKKVQEALTSTMIQLEEQRKLAAPFEQKENASLVEKAALIAEKNSLHRELESWKQRVHSLVSKFNQIDPDEYNKIAKRAETFENEVNQLKALKEALEKDGINAKAIVSKLNKDLAQQKALVQKQQSLLKKVQTEKESAATLSSDTAAIAKENTLLKEKIQKMDSDSKSSQTELKGANDRIEMLKQRMRQFQKTIGEQRTKIGALQSTMAATPTPAAETKAPSPPSTNAAPQKATVASSTSESISTQSKDERSSEGNGSEPVVHKKEPPAAVAVEMVNESLPSAPAGGFKFGPSTTAGPSKKEETQKRPALTEVVSGESKATNSSAPPAKKAKVDEKGSENVGDKDGTGKLESSGLPTDVADDRKSKATQTLKEQIIRKREALIQRKKQLEEQAKAKQQTHQSPSNDTPMSEIAAVPVPVVPEEATATPIVPESILQPVVDKKEEENSLIDAGVKATVEAIAHAVPAVKAKEAPPLAESSESEAPKHVSFGNSSFGNSTFGSGTSSAKFGSASFAQPPTGEAVVFGSSSSTVAFGSLTTGVTQTSSVFLDMKPPSSTAAPLIFGSASITLPTPSVVAPASVASPFSAFGGSTPFGGGSLPFGGGSSSNPAALPLFGSSTSIKRPAPETSSSSNEQTTAKKANVECESEAPKGGE